MINSLFVLALLGTPGDFEPCMKEEITQCEVNLADSLTVAGRALETCDYRNKILKTENQLLNEALLAKPTGKETFIIGVPDWVTVTGGVVLGFAAGALTVHLTK